ncbi:MAG: hypothetical protein U0794_09975 [Isosphaeraceae bacterium]
MKPDESRTPIPIKHRHELDHAAPTVIHDPEQDMPLLERWLRHAMESPARFWGAVAVVVVVLAGVSLLTSGVLSGGGNSSDAWTRLEAAKNSEEREKIASEFPKTPAERAALLQVAAEYYMRGFSDLPSNKDVALPTLKKALERFERVASEAPADSPQARVAALGVARTLEARNELDKALTQYEKVAKNPAWKDTPEARAAASLAELLRKPETIAFYKELYAYKAPEVTIPAGDTGKLPIEIPGLPGLPPPPGIGGTGSTGTGTTSPIKLPDPLTVPPPPPTRPEAKPEPKAEPKTIDLVPVSPKTEAPKAETPKPEAPKVEPPKTEAPKAATPKAEAPKPEVPKVEAPKAEAPKAAAAGSPSGGGLPDDPFTPAKK